MPLFSIFTSCLIRPKATRESSPANIYNKLPLGKTAHLYPEIEQALSELENLLRKHDLPREIQVEGSFRHFDAQGDEVMVRKDHILTKFDIGSVTKPTVPKRKLNLRPAGYYVDDSGTLRIFEYTEDKVPNLEDYPEFKTEFRNVISRYRSRNMIALRLRKHPIRRDCLRCEYRFNEDRAFGTVHGAIPYDGNFGIRDGCALVGFMMLCARTIGKSAFDPSLAHVVVDDGTKETQATVIDDWSSIEEDRWAEGAMKELE